MSFSHYGIDPAERDHYYADLLGGITDGMDDDDPQKLDLLIAEQEHRAAADAYSQREAERLGLDAETREV